MVLKIVFPERDFAEVSVTIMMMVCRQLSFCGCGCAKPTIKKGIYCTSIDIWMETGEL